MMTAYDPNAFHDERIEAVRGRVLRETVWFLLAVSLVYTAVLVGALAVNGTLHWPLLIPEVAVLAAGACIVAYGELFYRGARRDEMVASAQGRYYSRAFLVLVFATAGAYCLQVAVCLRTGLSDIIALGEFPSLLLRLGGLFLLLRLKGARVMFNYTVVEAPTGVYFRRVFGNIAKLGGLCAGFACLSAMLYVLPDMLSGRAALSGLWVILIAAVATWLSLAGDYLLLSAAELVSERAERRGRLSVASAVAFWVAAGAAALFAVTHITMSLLDAFNSAQTVMLISYLGRYCGTLETVMVAVCALYLAAECRTLTDRRGAPVGTRIERAGRRRAVLAILSLGVSAVQLLVPLYINGLERRVPSGDKAYFIQRFMNAYNTVTWLLSAVLLVLATLCVLTVLRGLTAAGHAPRWLTVAVAVLAVARILCGALALFGYSSATLVREALGVVQYVLLGVCLVRMYRTVELTGETA